MLRPCDIRGFRLLDLPPELKNRIYHFVFDSAKFQIERRGKAWYQDSDGRYIRFPLNLLYTCQQVRTEIGLMPIALASFESMNPKDIADLGRSLPLPVRSAVEHMRIDFIHKSDVGDLA